MSALKNRQQIYFWWKKKNYCSESFASELNGEPYFEQHFAFAVQLCNTMSECLVTSSHLTRQKSPKHCQNTFHSKTYPNKEFFRITSPTSTMNAARCTWKDLEHTQLLKNNGLKSVCSRCAIKIHRVCLPKFRISIPPHPTPLLFLLASNAFPDIGTVGRIEKKNHKKSRNMRPWFPMTLKVNIHIFGSTKCTIYRKKCSCFCSCFSLRCYYAHFSD